MSYSSGQLSALSEIEAVLNRNEHLSPDGDGWIATEWVMVVAWHDPETGENRLTRLCAPHVLQHHRIGLLHEALKDNWED